MLSGLSLRRQLQQPYVYRDWCATGLLQPIPRVNSISLRGGAPEDNPPVHAAGRTHAAAIRRFSLCLGSGRSHLVPKRDFRSWHWPQTAGSVSDRGDLITGYWSAVLRLRIPTRHRIGCRLYSCGLCGRVLIFGAARRSPERSDGRSSSARVPVCFIGVLGSVRDRIATSELSGRRITGVALWLLIDLCVGPHRRHTGGRRSSSAGAAHRRPVGAYFPGVNSSYSAVPSGCGWWRSDFVAGCPPRPTRSVDSAEGAHIRGAR